MKVTRLNNTQIQIENVIFNYDSKNFHWVAQQPIPMCKLEKYTNALHLFLKKESPEAEEHYESYFNYLRELKELLNSLNVCSEL